MRRKARSSYHFLLYSRAEMLRGLRGAAMDRKALPTCAILSLRAAAMPSCYIRAITISAGVLFFFAIILFFACHFSLFR